MSFGFDTGEAIPNADVPRMREYANIMTQVSDLVEIIEINKTKIDIENDFTINIEKLPDTIIPKTITHTIGEVSYITAKLLLASNTMYEGENIVPNYDTKPNIGMFYDTDIDETIISEDNLVDRQASNISLQFFGSNGIFMLSRTNLTETDVVMHDHATIYATGSKEPNPVKPVSDHDLSLFLVSIVNPLAVNRYSDKQLDTAAVETFAALNALFALAGNQQSSDSTRHLPGVDNYFKHHQEYDSKTDRFKTSFQIRFQSNEDPRRNIIAIHNLETDFQLSFKSFYDDKGDFTPENYEQNPAEIAKSEKDTPYQSPFEPYTPTLTELAFLAKILGDEVVTLDQTLDQTDSGFDVIEDTESDEPFRQLEDEDETKGIFDKIVTEETNREITAIGDIAVTQTFEQMLNENPDLDDEI